MCRVLAVTAFSGCPHHAECDVAGLSGVPRSSVAGVSKKPERRLSIFNRHPVEAPEHAQHEQPFLVRQLVEEHHEVDGGFDHGLFLRRQLVHFGDERAKTLVVG